MCSGDASAELGEQTTLLEPSQGRRRIGEVNLDVGQHPTVLLSGWSFKFTFRIMAGFRLVRRSRQRCGTACDIQTNAARFEQVYHVQKDPFEKENLSAKPDSTREPQ